MRPDAVPFRGNAIKQFSGTKVEFIDESVLYFFIPILLADIPQALI